MRFRFGSSRHWFWLALIFLALPISSYAQSVTGVGFASIKIPDPVNGGTKPGYVFYPSAAPSATTWIGPYKTHATRNAPPVPGHYPLVVISHGHGGSALSQHDLAAYLASHGFVAATLQFPRDNYSDYKKYAGTPAVLDGRPIQVKATISMLLHDPRWEALINPSKIDEAGFSAGGYTALMNVGAVPQFDRFISFCNRHPDNVEQQCKQVLRMEASGTAKAKVTALQKSVDRWGNPDDPRIKAAFVMAPLSLVFNKAGLSHINRPVFLYDGGDDQVLRLKYNTFHIAPLIKTLVGIKIIPNAGHYVFLGPCSKKLAKLSLSEPICKVQPGVDRHKVIKRVNADALAFFRGTLHVLPKH